MNKLSILQNFRKDFGMNINESEVIHLVVNVNRGEAEPIQVSQVVVEWCHSHNMCV